MKHTRGHTRRGRIGVDRGGQPETRKPALGGLLEVLLRLSETGLDSYLVEPGSFELVFKVFVLQRFLSFLKA